MTYQDFKTNDGSEGDLEAKVREVGKMMTEAETRGKAWEIYAHQNRDVQKLIREKYPNEFRSAQLCGI